MAMNPIDHQVPHRSTLHANFNQVVHLFVREYDGTRPPDSRKCVLMIHGRMSPSLTTFDLGYRNYSWAQSLAQDGFDVFMLDFQGAGLSPLDQMTNPCNTSSEQQRNFLIPNPLKAECTPDYPYILTNSQSEWEELDTVVNFIIQNRGVNKVALISNSAGAFAVGPYAVQHPDKVESVLLNAPVFTPNGDTNAPTLPIKGVPMQVTTKTLFKAGWDNELGDPMDCPNQREAGMGDIVWKAFMDIDQIGSRWGGTDPDHTEGVLRIRTFTHWAWNTEAVSRGTLGMSVPVCIIYGELDKTITTGLFSVTALYQAIPGDSKLMFKVACAGHLMNWEQKAKVLQNYSKQWLKNGRVENRTKGSFYRDKDGNIIEII